MCVDSSGSVSHVLVARAHVFLCQCAVWGSPRYAGVLDLFLLRCWLASMSAHTDVLALRSQLIGFCKEPVLGFQRSSGRRFFQKF